MTMKYCKALNPYVTQYFKVLKSIKSKIVAKKSYNSNGWYF